MKKPIYAWALKRKEDNYIRVSTLSQFKEDVKYKHDQMDMFEKKWWKVVKVRISEVK